MHHISSSSLNLSNSTCSVAVLNCSSISAICLGSFPFLILGTCVRTVQEFCPDSRLSEFQRISRAILPVFEKLIPIPIQFYEKIIVLKTRRRFPIIYADFQRFFKGTELRFSRSENFKLMTILAP